MNGIFISGISLRPKFDRSWECSFFVPQVLVFRPYCGYPLVEEGGPDVEYGKPTNNADIWANARLKLNW